MGRKQLPCAEVWVDGRQLVLDCTEDCRKAKVEEDAAEAMRKEAADMAVKAELAVEEDPAMALDLRERRKEKRKKRDEEAEERRLRDEAARRRKVFRFRLRITAYIVGSLI